MAKKQNIERKVEDMATICLLTKSSPKPAAGGLHFALIQEEKVLFPLSRGEKTCISTDQSQLQDGTGGATDLSAWHWPKEGYDMLGKIKGCLLDAVVDFSSRGRGLCIR